MGLSELLEQKRNEGYFSVNLTVEQPSAFDVSEEMVNTYTFTFHNELSSYWRVTLVVNNTLCLFSYAMLSTSELWTLECLFTQNATNFNWELLN